jgi:hypothetical protein
MAVSQNAKMRINAELSDASNEIINILNAAATNDTVGAQFTNVEWDLAHAYQIGDVVYNGNASAWYQCILANTNKEPPNGTYWSSLANSAALVYYGAGQFDLATGYAASNVVQLRLPNSTSNINMGGAIVVTGSPPIGLTPGSNFSYVTGVLVDCQGCVSGYMDMTNCITCFGFGANSLTNCASTTGLGAGTATYADNSVSILGACTGPSDVSRISYAVAIGHSVTSTATDATAIGKSITNNTATSVEIGVSDSTKLRIEAGGITAHSFASAASVSYASTMALVVATPIVTIAANHTTAATYTVNCAAVAPNGAILHLFITEGAGTGTVVATFGTHFKSTGTLTTASSGKSTITFIGDGTNWNEISRAATLA